MAQYRVDKRILSAEEYEEERTGLWALGLFVLGAFIVGHQVYQVIPQEWDKVIRFALILSAAIAGGAIPALFAGHVRVLFFLFLALGIGNCWRICILALVFNLIVISFLFHYTYWRVFYLCRIQVILLQEEVHPESFL